MNTLLVISLMLVAVAAASPYPGYEVQDHLRGYGQGNLNNGGGLAIQRPLGHDSQLADSGHGHGDFGYRNDHHNNHGHHDNNGHGRREQDYGHRGHGHESHQGNHGNHHESDHGYHRGEHGYGVQKSNRRWRGGYNNGNGIGRVSYDLQSEFGLDPLGLQSQHSRGDFGHRNDHNRHHDHHDYYKRGHRGENYGHRWRGHEIDHGNHLNHHESNHGHHSNHGYHH